MLDFRDLSSADANSANFSIEAVIKALEQGYEVAVVRDATAAAMLPATDRAPL